MKVVSHYTKNTPYEQEIQRLQESLHRLKITPYELVPTQDMGDWHGNVKQKSTVLLERFVLGEAILYVDADAELMSDPRTELENLMLDHDFGVNYFKDYRLNGGTLVFNGTPAAFELLTLWHRITNQRPHTRDQACLALAVKQLPTCRVRRLPPEYCYIFDLSAEAHPDVEPVIRQHQASRRFRRGYWFDETQLGKNVFKVAFKGSVLMYQEQSTDLTLLRSAELVVENGFSYFIVVDESRYTKQGTYTTPTRSGGQTYLISKPGKINTIVCFKEKPSTADMLFNARFVAKSIKEKYDLKDTSNRVESRP